MAVTSELAEDEVKICVVLKPGCMLPPEHLIAFANERMPHFAVPRFVEIVTGELPKTATGKFQKTALREAGVTATTWDRESVGYVVRR